ncbi:MAG: DUF4870 domain-containing protein [Verrucomicrobiota bacterium]|nr:DUF4870 domain-containing protein [Verrucomicrobiota bacterium]
MAAHLSGLLGHALTGVGHILGPLIIWLIKKGESEFASDQAKEALNAQISFTIYGLIAGALCFVLIGFPLLFALAIFDIVVVIMAAIKSNDGVRYRYPYILRLVN